MLTLLGFIGPVVAPARRSLPHVCCPWHHVYCHFWLRVTWCCTTSFSDLAEKKSCCAQFSSSAKLKGEQTSWFNFKTAKSLHEQFLSFNQGIRNGMNIYCNSFIHPDQRWNTLNSMEYSSLPRPKTQQGFQHFYIELLSSCPLLLAASFVCRASSECCFPKGYASIL